MKKLLFFKQRALLINKELGLFITLLFIGNMSYAQSAGFNNTFAILSANGASNTYYDLNAATANADFDGADLGTFNPASNSLILKGAEHNVYKCGTCDLTSTRLNYRIYSTGGSGSSYTQMTIPYTSTAGNGCGGQDQVWSATGNAVNILSGLAPGTYYLEVYSDATVTCLGGTVYASNNSANYKATFTVSGSYYVTTNNGSGLASNYATLAAAITALNAATITSPVVITLYGTETAPVGGYNITATGTATNTITIQGNGATNSIITAFTPQASGVKTDAIIKIVGGDYITIQGFKLQENAANTTTVVASNNMTEFGIGLFLTTATNGAQNNTIQNNTISLGSTYQNAFGIFSTSSSSSLNATLVATASTGTNSNNKFYSNTISNVVYGMYFICEPIPSTSLFETGIDIGGTSSATGNTITFGYATISDVGVSRFSGTSPAGINFRNGGYGDSVRFNSITSNSLPYAQSNGVFGIMMHGGGTAPIGVTYTSTISDNIVNLTNTGATAITGIDFGAALSTGTIVGSNNMITLNQTSSATNTKDVLGIKADYASATNSCSFNTIVINETQTTGIYSGNTRGITMAGAGTTLTASSNNITINQNSSGTGSYTGSIFGIDYSAAATTINSYSNTILVNQTTSVLLGIATAITAIKATTGATTVNIGGSGTGNTITFKQGFTGSGTYGSGIGYYVSLNAAAHGTVNVNYNTFNTTGSSFRAPSTLYGISTSTGLIATLKNINYNTMLIDKPSTTNNFIGIQDGSITPVTPQKIITNNSITVTNLAGSGLAFGIFETGGPAVPSLNSNFDNNTINFSGANTGQSIGILLGYSKGTASNNSITINNASSDVNGIWANQAGAAAFTITGNTLSLTSSNTAPSNMIGISGGAVGPFQIYNNTFSALNFTGIVTTTHNVSGIAVSAGTGNNIYNNHITNISDGAATSSGLSTINGVLISGGTTNVYKNKIQGITTTSVNGQAVINGISITGTAGAANVYNNLISNLNPTASTNVDGIRGISITSTALTSTNNIYYNTIAIGGSGGGATFGSSGIYHTASSTSTTAALNLRNNIISNNCTASGLGIAVAFRRFGTNLENYVSTSNNNLFYGGVLLNDGTASYTTIGALKTLLSTRDQNSIAENPTFQSTSGSSADFLKFDLTTPTQIESNAINIPSYIDDYSGVIRQGNPSYAGNSTTGPDLGAWELNGTIAVPMSFTSSTTEQLSGNAYVNQNNQAIIRVKIVTTGAINPINVTSLSLNANGTTDINNINISTAKIYYTTNTTFSTANLFGSATPNTTNFDVSGTQALVEGNNYFWLTYDIVPGANQGNLIDGECTSLTVNSTSQTPTITAPSGEKSIQSAMIGTYTVGASQTYTTLTAAANDISLRGVSGAVTFSLESDYSSTNETFPISITQYTGQSVVNTLNIKPATGVSAVISGSPSGSASLIQLLGADYVTIDGSNNGTTTRNLTFTNTGTVGLTAGVQISSLSSSNGATNNTIKNCKFDAGSYGISTGGLSISSNALVSNSNNTLTNNEFVKMNYGVDVRGYTTAPYDANWVINNNLFGSTSSSSDYLLIRALRFDNASNFNINNNTIAGVANSTLSATSLFGMYFVGAYDTGTIYNNKISNIKHNFTDNNPAYGIFISPTTATNNISIYNNSIYDVNAYGVAANNTVIAGLYFTGSNNPLMSGFKIYNNTISISGTHLLSTSIGFSHAIYFHANITGTGFDLQNNIFSNTSTMGTRVSIYAAAINTIFTNIKNNNFYSASSTTFGLANSSAAAYYTTLSTLQTALGTNASSNVNVLPNFVSASDVHLNTIGNCSLNNAGTPIGTVTTDIDGDTRSITTPDIGSDEFTGTNSSATASSTPTLCIGSPLTTITIATTGATGIGTATVLPAGVTAAWASNTISITGTPTEGGTFNYIIPLTGGCGNDLNATGTITVNTTAAPTASAQSFCNSGTVAGLTATGTGLQWYSVATNGTALDSTTALATGDYFVSQTLNSCEGPRTSVAVTVNTTAAPTASAQSFCNSGTVAGLMASGTGLQWYSVATNGTALASTTALATGDYFVSQTLNSCEGPRTSVAVTVNTTAAPTASAQSFCNSETVAGLMASGTALQWYSVATNGTALASTTALVTGDYFVSQTLNSCEGPRTSVAVTVNTTAAPTGDATQSLSSSLTISSIVVTGTNVVWYASSANAAAGLEPLPNTTPLTNTTYYATQTVGGCTSLTSLAVSITTLANQDFELDSIKIFPNPSTAGNFVTITSSIKEDIDVEVFDILGKHILTQKVISNILDVSNLHSGMYLLKISQKERTTIKKLVIK